LGGGAGGSEREQPSERLDRRETVVRAAASGGGRRRGKGRGRAGRHRRLGYPASCSTRASTQLRNGHGPPPLPPPDSKGMGGVARGGWRGGGWRGGGHCACAKIWTGPEEATSPEACLSWTVQSRVGKDAWGALQGRCSGAVRALFGATSAPRPATIGRPSGAMTAVLAKTSHANCCTTLTNQPSRGRRGRFVRVVQQLACEVFERTAVRAKPPTSSGLSC